MKKHYFSTFIILSVLIILALNNCTENKKNVSNEMLVGQQSLIQNCGTCHNLPNKPATGIAPSFYEIKEFYLQKSEEEFTNSIISFLNTPTTSGAKMKKAVEQYGLMPKMSFSEKELKQITYYLYHSDLENYEEISGEIDLEEETIDYLETGRKLAQQTKATLGKNLMQSIKQKGVEGAVEFCNEKAITLTDSMANELNALIKRVSNKPRNEKNKANQFELNYITELKEGKNIQGITRQIGKKIIGYYPIETNEMCMKCHGNYETDINKKTALKINELYPTDKAIGYSPNQIRGIWVVEMDKK